MSGPSPAVKTPHFPRKKGSWLLTGLKVVLVVVAVGLASFIGVGLYVLDGKYTLSREITIAATPGEVHKQVGDLREWPNWLPFIKQDPSVKTTIDQPTGVGAYQTWTSDNGDGELRFTTSDEEKGVGFDMIFDKKYASKGSLTYEKSGDETRVTWKMTGQNTDFLGKWMALCMPTVLGPMFEQGLKDLKAEVEGK